MNPTWAGRSLLAIARLAGAAALRRRVGLELGAVDLAPALDARPIGALREPRERDFNIAQLVSRLRAIEQALAPRMQQGAELVRINRAHRARVSTLLRGAAIASGGN